MAKKGCCRECKYADWDADGCTCMIDGRLVYNASDYTCDQYRPAKPLTNGDRIRQMTDEELAEWFAPHMMCKICDKKDRLCGCNPNECKKYALVYMKKEASEDDER